MTKFILVEHTALTRGKHWDLRFSIPNSKNWASFAMNQMPPEEPGKRVYITRTNDHSEKEALFIGKIPEGTYGSGSLKKVDGGNCNVIKYTNAHIVIDFKGKKLKGIYHFINMGVIRRDYKSKVYAFFKAKNL